MSKKDDFSEYISAEECESLAKNFKKYNFSEHWSEECESVVENVKK